MKLPFMPAVPRGGEVTTRMITLRMYFARGKLPRDRVAVPRIGEYCPRHHGRAGAGPTARPCLLCRPDLVPAAHGGHAMTSRADAAILGARLRGRVPIARPPAARAITSGASSVSSRRVPRSGLPRSG